MPYRLVTKLFRYMLLSNKFNNVNVTRTYGMILKCEFFVLQLCYVCSYELITRNKRFNVRANIYQRKVGFCTQIIILLKP